MSKTTEHITHEAGEMGMLITCKNCGADETLHDHHPSEITDLIKELESFREKHIDCKEIRWNPTTGETFSDFLFVRCKSVCKQFERFVTDHYDECNLGKGFGTLPFVMQEGLLLSFLETNNIYLDLLHTTAKSYECTLFTDVGMSDGTISSKIGKKACVKVSQDRETVLKDAIAHAFIILQHIHYKNER
jgi:hypothetical protein